MYQNKKSYLLLLCSLWGSLLINIYNPVKAQRLDSITTIIADTSISTKDTVPPVVTPIIGNAKDTVFLNNRSMLIGELKGVDLGKLKMDVSDAGIVNIKLQNIRFITAVRKKYRIELLDGEVFYGYLFKGRHPGTMMVVAGPIQTSIPVMDLVAIRELDESFGKRLKGSINAGASYTRSTELFRLNAGNQLRYETPKWRFQEDFSLIYAQSEEYTGFERIETNLRATYEMGKALQQFNNLLLQSLPPLGVQFRINALAGLGDYLVRTRHTFFLVGTGVSGLKEIATETKNVTYSLELPLIVRLNLFQLDKPKLDLSVNNQGFLSLTERGRFRLDHSTNLSWELIKDFKLNLQFLLNYDTKPRSGARKYDSNLVFTVGYTL